MLLGEVTQMIVFFFQTRKDNGQLVKLVDFMEYSRYFQKIYPSQGTQAMLTQRQRKFELFNPSQASGAAQARCSSAALPSHYITRPVALVQHSSGRGAAQRSSRHTATAGRLRSICLVCVLHNTITLTLTAVRSVKFLHSIG